MRTAGLSFKINLFSIIDELRGSWAITIRLQPLHTRSMHHHLADTFSASPAVDPTLSLAFVIHSSIWYPYNVFDIRKRLD